MIRLIGRLREIIELRTDARADMDRDRCRARNYVTQTTANRVGLPLHRISEKQRVHCK